VIIGSGVGGLCCGGILARYGEDVLVLESHDIPGGAAHSFDVKGYHFDSGPSLFSGLSSRGPQANPLAQVCQTSPSPHSKNTEMSANATNFSCRLADCNKFSLWV
jgi:phytoene dehydrogenase-like protein